MSDVPAPADPALLPEHLATTGGPDTIVCVIGMHRSGTSLVTRILNLLGVDLGPAEQLMAPYAVDNPKGVLGKPATC